MSRLLPEPTADDWYAGLLAGQDYLLSLGITGWQDAIVGRSADLPDPIGAYLRAAAAGTLAGHVVGALWWDRYRGLDQLPELIERRRTGQAGRFRATSVKIMLDGVAENHTAAMLEPYLDGHGCSTGHSGLDFIDPAELPRFVTALDRQGFQVHFHALGDRAVRNALDAIEAARTANGAIAGQQVVANTVLANMGGRATTWRTFRWCIPTTSPGSPACRPPRTSSRCGPRTSLRWTS